MSFWVIGNGFSSYSSVAEREVLCFHFTGPSKYFFSIAWFSPTFHFPIIAALTSENKFAFLKK